MAGASPALLTCPRHVGRNRFAYYTRTGGSSHIVVAGLAPAMLARCPSRQTLRGVHPERNRSFASLRMTKRRAQGDIV